MGHSSGSLRNWPHISAEGCGKVISAELSSVKQSMRWSKEGENKVDLKDFAVFTLNHMFGCCLVTSTLKMNIEEIQRGHPQFCLTSLFSLARLKSGSNVVQ